MPKLDPNAMPERGGVPESFKDPKHGWLDYEPISKVIQQPRKPISWPIGVPDNLFGTKQPNVPTCSLPGPGNLGCPKASECPIAQMGLTHLGPGMVILRKRDATTQMECYHHFSARDVRGKLIYQINLSEDGWKMDTTRTTIPVMGSVPVLNKLGQKTGATVKGDWERPVPDLLPYWWPLLKKEGKPLPAAAKRYPQFAEDEEEQSTNSQSLPSLPSASQGGRKKRTRKASARSGTGSHNAA